VTTDKPPEVVYHVRHDRSDWSVALTDYVEGIDIPAAPFHYYDTQGLLVINITFLGEVWSVGTDEPLIVANLKRAALTVARLRFPETKKVRISFNEFWPN
jgi:hypothetical protein